MNKSRDKSPAARSQHNEPTEYVSPEDLKQWKDHLADCLTDLHLYQEDRRKSHAEAVRLRRYIALCHAYRTLYNLCKNLFEDYRELAEMLDAHTNTYMYYNCNPTTSLQLLIRYYIPEQSIVRLIEEFQAYVPPEDDYKIIDETHVAQAKKILANIYMLLIKVMDLIDFCLNCNRSRFFNSSDMTETTGLSKDEFQARNALDLHNIWVTMPHKAFIKWFTSLEDQMHSFRELCYDNPRREQPRRIAEHETRSRIEREKPRSSWIVGISIKSKAPKRVRRHNKH